MIKLSTRSTVLTLLLLSLAALPAHAQIPPGTDFWVTPANGQTLFQFPAGDVESLCGALPSSSWDHHVFLRGVPQQGADWDTAVARLDDAVFDATGRATTRIQVKSLSFASLSAQTTPCGRLNWTANLFGPQPVTVMTIQRRTSRGGFFLATISVRVEMRAFNADSGAYVGSLFYSRDLPDSSSTGTPWSFGTAGNFRPGMTETDNCIDVLRKKLSMTDPDSDHFYYISNLIAQGKCHE